MFTLSVQCLLSLMQPTLPLPRREIWFTNMPTTLISYNIYNSNLHHPILQTAELMNSSTRGVCAQANHLKLNRAKTVIEVIFTDSRRKLQPCRPPELPDIRRATSIRMLCITLTNHLSVSDHVLDVICRCAQSLHALKTMRCHGMNSEDRLESVVLAKHLLLRFATTSDKGRIEAHVRRAVRLNMYRSPVYVA